MSNERWGGHNKEAEPLYTVFSTRRTDDVSYRRWFIGMLKWLTECHKLVRPPAPSWHRRRNRHIGSPVFRGAGWYCPGDRRSCPSGRWSRARHGFDMGKEADVLSRPNCKSCSTHVDQDCRGCMADCHSGERGWDGTAFHAYLLCRVEVSASGAFGYCWFVTNPSLPGLIHFVNIS